MNRILLIDDEKDARTLLSTRLRLSGFNVVVAETAMEGYEVAKSEDIDLILLDLKLPEVSGEELFDVLELFLKKTKVIVCSSLSVDEQKRVIPNATDYFDKGLGMDELETKLREALRA